MVFSQGVYFQFFLLKIRGMLFLWSASLFFFIFDKFELLGLAKDHETRENQLRVKINIFIVMTLLIKCFLVIFHTHVITYHDL